MGNERENAKLIITPKENLSGFLQKYVWPFLTPDDQQSLEELMIELAETDAANLVSEYSALTHALGEDITAEMADLMLRRIKINLTKKYSN